MGNNIPGQGQGNKDSDDKKKEESIHFVIFRKTPKSSAGKTYR